MSDTRRPGATLNESGPWGGDGQEPGKGPGRKPRPRVPGPSAVDALLQRSRMRFGGGGGHRGGVPQLPFAFGGWIAIAVVVLWLIFTSIHTIGPQQRGVITRFGKYVGTLQPGLGLTFPLPIDRVRKLDVDNIHAIDIDSNIEGSGEDSGQNLMLTGDENIIDLAYSVRWNIRDPELYLFELADPDGTIREVAESAMREAVARVSLNQAIGSQRGEIEARVAQRMQELLDQYRAGVAIQGVAIRQADPPADVMDAFKDVSAAQQEAQSYLNNARAYRTQVEANAAGEASAFDQVYAQYKLAPEVTRRRMYYETMEKVLAKSDKTIVEAPGVNSYLPIQPAKAQPQAVAK
jgi:modulator of FtsH protease HflK